MYRWRRYRALDIGTADALCGSSGARLHSALWTLKPLEAPVH